MQSQIVPRAKQLWREISDDDVTGLAAELAYRFFLALFPFAIFLAALGGFIAQAAGVDDPAGQALDLLGDSLPDDAASVISQQVAGVVESKDVGLLSFGLIGTLWAASSAMGSVIKALNRAFDVKEERPFWKKTLVAIGLTMLTAGAVVVAFGVLITGQAFAKDIAEALGFGRAFEIVLLIVRIPIALVLVAIAVAFLYWAAPNTDTPFKWLTPGAAVFTIAWLAASVGFAWYVTNFGSYNATYGALGGVVILLTWFYLTSLMILVGAEINAMVDAAVEGEPQPSDRQETIAKEQASGRAARSGKGLKEEDMQPQTAPDRQPEVVRPSEGRPLLGLGVALGALAAAFVFRRVVR